MFFVSEGLRPLPPAPKLRIHGPHLGALGPHLGDLGQHLGGLGLHFGGLGRHFGGLGRHLGHGLGPEEAWRRQNGLDCTLMQAGALFSEDPGIQATAKV